MEIMVRKSFLFIVISLSLLGCLKKERSHQVDPSTQSSSNQQASNSRQEEDAGQYALSVDLGKSEILIVRDCKDEQGKDCHEFMVDKEMLSNEEGLDLDVNSIDLKPNDSGYVQTAACTLKMSELGDEAIKAGVEQASVHPKDMKIMDVEIEQNLYRCIILQTTKADMLASVESSNEGEQNLAENDEKRKDALIIGAGAAIGAAISAGVISVGYLGYIFYNKHKKNTFKPNDLIAEVDDVGNKKGIVMTDLDDTMWKNDYDPREIKGKDGNLTDSEKKFLKEKLSLSDSDLNGKTLKQLVDDGHLLELNGKYYNAPLWYDGAVEKIAKYLDDGYIVATNSTNFRPHVKDLVEASLAKQLEGKKGVTILEKTPSGKTKTKIQGLYIGTAAAIGVEGRSEIVAGVRSRLGGHKYGIWQQIVRDMTSDKVKLAKNPGFFTFDDKPELYKQYDRMAQDIGAKHHHVVAESPKVTEAKVKPAHLFAFEQITEVKFDARRFSDLSDVRSKVKVEDFGSNIKTQIEIDAKVPNKWAAKSPSTFGRGMKVLLPILAGAIVGAGVGAAVGAGVSTQQD